MNASQGKANEGDDSDGDERGRDVACTGRKVVNRQPQSARTARRRLTGIVNQESNHES